MKYLLDYGFNEEDIQEFSLNVPSVLLEQLFHSYRLVSKNLDYLIGLGVKNVKEIFWKNYDMFLMDASNFEAIFNKYERDDLLEKIEQNIEIVEFL